MPYPAIINGGTANAVPLKSWLLRRFHDYRWYNQRFSYTQNTEACDTIIKFIASNQHAFPEYYSGPCLTIRTVENKYLILIPRLNRLMGFCTKYGTVYIKIVSHDHINVHGIELAVKKRRWGVLLDHGNLNFFNWVMLKILKKSGIKPSPYYGTTAVAPIRSTVDLPAVRRGPADLECNLFEELDETVPLLISCNPRYCDIVNE